MNGWLCDVIVPRCKIRGVAREAPNANFTK